MEEGGSGVWWGEGQRGLWIGSCGGGGGDGEKERHDKKGEEGTGETYPPGTVPIHTRHTKERGQCKQRQWDTADTRTSHVALQEN